VCVCLSQTPGIREPLRVSSRNTKTSDDTEDELTAPDDAGMMQSLNAVECSVSSSMAPVTQVQSASVTCHSGVLDIRQLCDSVLSTVQSPVSPSSSFDVNVSPAGKATPTRLQGFVRLDRKATPTVTASNLREFSCQVADGVVHDVSVQTRPALTAVVETRGGQEIVVPVTVQRHITSVSQSVIDRQPVDDAARGSDEQAEQPRDVEPQVSANQQVRAAGEAEEQLLENVMYTNDEVTEYVSSVDLSYYNQQSQQQPQPQSTHQHQLRSVLTHIVSILFISVIIMTYWWGPFPPVFFPCPFTSTFFALFYFFPF